MSTTTGTVEPVRWSPNHGTADAAAPAPAWSASTPSIHYPLAKGCDVGGLLALNVGGHGFPGVVGGRRRQAVSGDFEVCVRLEGRANPAAASSQVECPRSMSRAPDPKHPRRTAQIVHRFVDGDTGSRTGLHPGGWCPQLLNLDGDGGRLRTAFLEATLLRLV